MATAYKIHPAIGIARVGNSPDELFIGPERIGEEPNPAGGFKDAQCRVKRQAARFRIFAHHDDNTVTEVTSAEADITWTVHLVNKKAAHPDRGNTESDADLTIDPGTRTINGANQRKLFDTGQIRFNGVPPKTVPLGEIRSDNENRLLVLGGSGDAGSPVGTLLSGNFWATEDWYDDVSDGPVTATITLHSDNSTPTVAGAWVIVGPPKFAPHQENSVTLYDRILQAMIDASLVNAPTQTSYTNDIYPILQRARDTRWVVNLSPSAMAWADPVTADATRQSIFNRLKVPGANSSFPQNMPRINDSGTDDDCLTPTQFAHMERWKDNNYTNDWTGVPPVQAQVTPDGLDRAALEACVGGAFFPGIEAGGLNATSRPIIDPDNFVEAFRLKETLAPGSITFTMALPWQNDFFQCDTNWWPVPRPNQVIRGGAPNQSWTDGIVATGQDMVDKWHQLGFVVRQGAQHVEAERCNTASIILLTPMLNFKDVPQGPMGMTREVSLAITFEVISPGGAVTLEYAPGGAPAHPQLTAYNTSVTVGPTPPNGSAMARLWVKYSTGSVGDLPPQTLTVQVAGGAQSWSVTIIGNTVGRKTAAAALVLDRSGSMSQDRGDGQTKHTSLQEAASIFVDVMLEGDGVGVVRFNEDAQVLQGVLQLGDGSGSDANRIATKDIINGNGLDPNGQTSIGDGIFEGHGILNTAGTFDVKALVVLTDGIENSTRMIADVAGEIDEFTYAIGLGQPQNISVPALQTISGNNGGYLLVTGPITGDNTFLLQKYFLQILAGISNAEVVLDPEGHLLPGQVERVPFQLTDSDTGVDVILLTPFTDVIDFRLQTPSGRIIEPWLAGSQPNMRFVMSNGVTYYRIVLPLELIPDRLDGGGTWHALLTIGRPRLERSDTRLGTDESIRTGMFARQAAGGRIDRTAEQSARRIAEAAFAEIAAKHRLPPTQRTLPYSLVVHAYSNISLETSVEQASFGPDAVINLHTSLAQSGIPLTRNVHVVAEVTRQDGPTTTIELREHAEGQFATQFAAAKPGVYRFRIITRGETALGEPFTRERTLTAAVWLGDDKIARDPDGEVRGEDAGRVETGGREGCLVGLLKGLLKQLSHKSYK